MSGGLHGFDRSVLRRWRLGGPCVQLRWVWRAAFTVETLMCPEENGWTGAAGTLVTRNCPYGYRGTRTRRCSIQGVWGEADESACEEIRCPAFDGWEEMGVGEVQVRPCEKGFAILTCGADGQWEGSPNVCCTCGVDR